MNLARKSLTVGRAVLAAGLAVPAVVAAARLLFLAPGVVVAAVLAAGASGTAGRPDPSFSPGGPLPVSEGASVVAVADFNRDGKADVAAAKRASSDVTVLLGDGAGGFRTAGVLRTAGSRTPTSVAVADVNRDGTVDIVVANAGSSDLTLLLGDGAGGFRPSVGSPVPVGALVAAVTAADLNGDRNVDLVAPVYGESGGRSRLAILLGDGSGRFVPPPGSPLSLPRRTDGSPVLGVADFNADRRPDLAVGFGESAGISILLGDGVGGFGAPTTILAGAVPSAFVAADLNRDGKADLAVTRSDASRSVTVLLGSGFRAAAGSPIVLGRDEFPSAIVAADLSGDGSLDLAANISPNLAVFVGDGSGRFRRAADSPFAAPGEVIGAVDFDADGKPDLALDDGILFQTRATPPVLAGRGPAGRADRAFSTRGLITGLAADGHRAAVMTTIKGSCGRIVVWTAPGGKSASFKPGECGSILCGSECVSNVAVGGGRVAWIESGGGNSSESTVVAAKLSGGATREIEHVANGNGAGGDPEGGYIGQLLGDGPLLAYNSWQVACTHRDSDHDFCDRWGLADIKLVRVVGGRRVVVKRGADACRLAGVGGGRLAVTGTVPWWNAGVWECSLGAGASARAVTVLAPDGSRVASVPAVDANPPRAIALSRTRLAFLRTFSLDLYDPATGAMSRSLSLGPAAALALEGVNSRLALLGGPHRLVLVRLGDGKLMSFPLRPGAATGLVGASLTEAGLFYAFNTPRAAAKGRIVFVPIADVVRRLAG
jgi:hypothetical protein